jgi:ribosomal protein S27E
VGCPWGGPAGALLIAKPTRRHMPRYHFKCRDCVKETIVYLCPPDQISEERVSCAFCASTAIELIETVKDDDIVDPDRINQLSGQIRNLQERLRDLTGETEPKQDPYFLN